MSLDFILQKHTLSKDDLIFLLQTKGKEEQTLFDFSGKIKQQHVGNIVYLRGLIEYSNNCRKNCYYCGIRRSNNLLQRYCLTEDEVLQTVQFAYHHGYGSIAIQSGELSSRTFINQIDRILKESKRLTNGEIGITLSCGEQSEETYRRWFESGADRYLLRIETSSEELFLKLHPQDKLHRFANRLNALEALKKIGYQVGTGVMIGLPFQTTEHLADDLLFMKTFDIDMCGMGPYIEHRDTPLYAYKDQLLSLKERLNLSFKMIALLRIMMHNINIAATTALQAIEKNARERAIQIGANVLMPNITPGQYQDNYFLYDNKPLSESRPQDELHYLEQRLKTIGHEIGYFRQGNSLNFYLKKSFPLNQK